MTKNIAIENRIFAINTDQEFNAVAIDVFQFQYQNNLVYKAFVDAMKIDPSSIHRYSDIPFLPIEFFKTKTILCGNHHFDDCFTSSATTGTVVSRHYVKDIGLYEKSFVEAFKLFYGNPEEYHLLALLPNYLERTGSSLVYMADRLIKLSGHEQSGFFLNDYDHLIEVIQHLKLNKQKVILLGVTYALLDLAEKGLVLNDHFIVMETGGMKGRRKEMIKEELYSILKASFGVKAIHSEYGMTELLSQAYSKNSGLFECPPWMKIMIRDPNDPLHYFKTGRSGGINVIDLANVYSCSFIATKDLGKLYNDGTFEVLGRFDNSDIRGCNLMAG